MTKRGKVLSTKVVYSGKWVDIIKNRIRKPDGTEAIHEIAKRKDCVLILAFKNGGLFLIRQYRYPADEFLWEFPGGFINNHETPLKAAIRELEEESGLIPLKIDAWGSIWTWPSFSTQKIFIFFASKFTKGKVSKDSSESDLNGKFIPYQEVMALAERGTIKSSSTLAALTIFNRKRKATIS